MSEAGTEQQVLNMFEAQSLFDMHVPPCQLSMMAAGQNRKDMSVYTFTWFDAWMLFDGHGEMVRGNSHLCHCAWWTSSVKGWTEPMNGWNLCRKPNKQNRTLAYAICEKSHLVTVACKVKHFENNLCDHTRRVAKFSKWFLVGMVGSMCMFIIWLPRRRFCAGFCQRAPKQIMNIQYRMQYTRLWLDLSDFRIPTEHCWSSIDVPQLACRTKNQTKQCPKNKNRCLMTF